MLAAGEKKLTLTSANLSKAFNARIQICQYNDRYTLKIEPESKKVFS